MTYEIRTRYSTPVVLAASNPTTFDTFGGRIGISMINFANGAYLPGAFFPNDGYTECVLELTLGGGAPTAAAQGSAGTSLTFSVGSAGNMYVGQTITGSSFIPSSTTISAINYSTGVVTLSNSTTSAIGSGVWLYYGLVPTGTSPYISVYFLPTYAGWPSNPPGPETAAAPSIDNWACNINAVTGVLNTKLFKANVPLTRSRVCQAVFYNNLGVTILGSASVIMHRTTDKILSMTYNGAIYDNSTSSVYSNVPIVASGSGYGGPVYVSFSTQDQDVELTDLKLMLSLTGTAGSGTTSVGLYSNEDNYYGDGAGFYGLPLGPGPLLTNLATIADTSLTLTPTLYDIAVSNYALTANTRYWIGLSTANSSLCQWSKEASYENWVNMANLDPNIIGVQGEYSRLSNNGIFGTSSNISTSSFIMKVTTV